METIRSVFGDARPTKVYVGAYDGRDGFACPFCQSVTVRTPRWPRCENPGCHAYTAPDDPEAVGHRQAFLDHAHAVARHEDETRDWVRTQEWAREYQDERQREEAARWESLRTEAGQRGACVTCLRYDVHVGRLNPRFVKHRTECPRERRA